MSAFQVVTPMGGATARRLCVVEYKDDAAVGVAKKMTGLQIGDKALNVSVTLVSADEPTPTSSFTCSSSNGTSDTAAATAPTATATYSSSTNNNSNNSDPSAVARTIYVGNLPADATESTVRAFFGTAANNQQQHLVRMGDAARNKDNQQFAFVEFSTLEHATQGG